MEASQSGRGPLAGVRVIELSSTVAGPFCGRLLADFGAEVIKIEPAEGDALRLMGERKDGISLYAASILRNKKLIALDMRRSEAQALVRDLVRQADIFVENFRPGTMEKWGLGYDALSAENPGLVIVTDRSDLDRQIATTFRNCGFENPVTAASVRHLGQLLDNAEGQTLLTTIQKFEEDLTREGLHRIKTPMHRGGKVIEPVCHHYGVRRSAR